MEENRTERPSSVTLVGLFVIVTSVLPIMSLLPLIVVPGLREGAAHGARIAGQTVATAISFNLMLIVASAAMLKGLNAGRIAVLIAWPLRLIIFALGRTGAPVLPGIIAGVIGYAIIVILLTRPEASDYFRRE